MVKTFHQVPTVHRSTVFITKNVNVIYTTLMAEQPYYNTYNISSTNNI